MALDIQAIYKEANALLEGHFLLSSGNHSRFYLQSAKVLENPKTAELLAVQLALQIKKVLPDIQTVCSPALGGILAGYELARALGARFIFTERSNGEMTLRRGFEVQPSEKVLICEDIITTGGSANEAASEIKRLGGNVVGFAALANRGICVRVGSGKSAKADAKLPKELPFFALEEFEFEIFQPESCPMCKEGSVAIKPGSRGN